MKTERLVFLIFFLICGCSISQKQDTTYIKPSAHKERQIYFVTVPIHKLSSIQSPCIDVIVEDNTFSMELDLGYRGDLIIRKQSLDIFPSKNFIREKPMYGFRGKKYPTKLYQIPKLKIGKMTFFKPIVQEEGEEFIKDSLFVQEGIEPAPRDIGRLGWELFHNVNLLVDVRKSQIAFCDSLETLENQGYPIKSLIKIPLFLDRGLVELEAETPEGTLRCMLDTGSTWNILNNEIDEEMSIDEAVWESENILKFPTFKISGKEFGPIKFHRIPIKIPIHIEAILGMEFFQEHAVFLDFSDKTAYISKAN